MLQNTRQNFHHSKLPKLGAIVIIQQRGDILPPFKHRKFIVESFPLCDGAYWKKQFMSYGIHTVNIRALDNGERYRVSGFYCEEI